MNKALIFTTLLSCSLLVGCTTGTVKTAQSFGFSFVYKTKKLCKNYKKAETSFNQYQNKVSCFTSKANNNKDLIDFSTEIAELNTLGQEVKTAMIEYKSIGEEFCRLQDQGVKKIADDHPLYKKTFEYTERQEKSSVMDDLNNRLGEVKTKLNDKFKMAAESNSKEQVMQFSKELQECN